MKFCEICGGECVEEALNFEHNKALIFMCTQCGLYQADNMEFNYKLNDNIDFNNMEKSFKRLRQKNFEIIVNYLISVLPKGSVGLEVGSLHGWFLDIINKHYHCYGIEPLKDLVECSDNHTVFKGFFPDDLPDSISDLDFLIFNDVFEHIPNCNELMRHCNNVLKKKGHLIINLPLSSGIFFKLAQLFNRIGKPDYLVRLWQLRFSTPHLYYFNKENLTALAGKHGFEFLHYQELDTLDKNNIKERVMTDATQKNVNVNMSLIKIGLPFLNLFKKDVGFLVFRKVS